MDAIRVTVTPADLDKGIAAAHPRVPNCENCVMAQALMRQLKLDRAEVGMEVAYAGDLVLEMSQQAQDIINLFDNQAYDELRQQLPVTFVLEAR